MATRRSKDEPFAAPVPITELNSPNDDCFASISMDGARLYFNHNADTSGALGLGASVWFAERSCVMRD